ncbi:MAG: glycosyltransferase [Fimbriimonadaceae bacterium]
MKIVTLSASTGNGHMAAAYAIHSELERRGHYSRVVDVLDHTGRAFRGWYRGGYEVLVRKKPEFWGTLYRASDRPRAAYLFQTLLDSAFVEKMRRELEGWDPDWVLCTHSLPQPALHRWRKALRFRFAIVVTDLYPQRMWLRGKPDFAFVPTKWSLDVLQRRDPRLAGLAEVVGIPVDPRFVPADSKSAARAAAGLEPGLPTVVLTAGGIGGGPIGPAMEALRDSLPEAQVVVVCGRNEAALETARMIAAKGGPVKFTTTGHVDTETMAGLLQASDLLVAKPGGLTTFEALGTGTPFVVYRKFLIPGQEERNALFLRDCGAGTIVDRPAELGTIVAELLASPERLAAMSLAGLAHATPDSAERIAARLENLSLGAGVTVCDS